MHFEKPPRKLITFFSNFLGFIAADLCFRGGSSKMLIVMDYHQKGSLFDFLKNHEIDFETMLLMCSSVVNGLEHLHDGFCSTQGKPAIAHRDLKSKNILVKDNLECCIADFGLSVKYYR